MTNLYSQTLRWFYLISVTLIFAVAMLVQLPRFKINANVKMLIFVAWAAYGVVPTLHWAIAMGGFDNPMVQVSQIIFNQFGLIVIYSTLMMNVFSCCSPV